MFIVGVVRSYRMSGKVRPAKTRGTQKTMKGDGAAPYHPYGAGTFLRSAKALLPPHECGGSLDKWAVLLDKCGGSLDRCGGFSIEERNRKRLCGPQALR